AQSWPRRQASGPRRISRLGKEEEMMRAAKHASRVPGAAQHLKGVYARLPPGVSRAQRSVKRSATVRCRPGTVSVRGDPGSAVHRFALHRIRDTLAMPVELNQKGNTCR